MPVLVLVLERTAVQRHFRISPLHCESRLVLVRIPALVLVCDREDFGEWSNISRHSAETEPVCLTASICWVAGSEMRSEEDPVLDVPISVLKRGRGPWKRGACVRALSVWYEFSRLVLSRKKFSCGNMAAVIRNHVLTFTRLFLVHAEYGKSFGSSSFNYQGNSHHHRRRRQHHNQSNYHLTLSCRILHNSRHLPFMHDCMKRHYQSPSLRHLGCYRSTAHLQFILLVRVYRVPLMLTGGWCSYLHLVDTLLGLSHSPDFFLLRAPEPDVGSSLGAVPA